ncbi:MAG TPA: dihydrodipicolinate synthase family protein [Vicinamibacterales bacterium]|nr:dihydrodipicolinate synthase family protein [Vicinamibacterales bacterium]
MTDGERANGLPQPLRGIIPPMVTPLLDRDTLDVAGLERLIEHVLAGGVHGLFVLGTTGEAPSLSYRLRKELIQRACAQVHGRVPILAGITDTAFVESVRMAGVAADAGAAAVVQAAPYYFPAGQAELLEYLGHLVKELPLPLFLYNMPSHTKVSFRVETVRRAADLPGIVGLKDSSASMIYFQRLLSLFHDRPEFTLLVGPEELLGESVLLGAHGGASGGANFHPRLYVRLYEAARARDLDEVTELQRQVMRISSGIYGVGRFGSSYLKGLKCALSLLGICDDFMAEPFHRFNAPERARVEQELRALGLLATEAPR